MKRSLSMVLIMIMMIVMMTTGCSSQEASTSATNNDQDQGKSSTGVASKPEEPKYSKPQVLVYNAGSESNFYDPRNTIGLDERNLLNHVFEGLMRDIGNGLELGVAEKYEVSDDGTTYTFTIREDAKWSDGVPLKAEHFHYAIISQLEPTFASISADRLFGIVNAEEFHISEEGITAEDVGVRVIDERTIEYTFKHATPFLLNNFAGVSFFPVRQDYVDNDGTWSLFPETFIGNGPFKMIEWSPMEQMVFVKNENYWDIENIILDELIFIFIEEASTALAAFQIGEVDVITSVPSMEIDALINSGHALITPMVATEYYSINMQSIKDEAVREALSKKEVRHALSLAVNRKLITDRVVGGGRIPATGMVPVGTQGPNGTDFRSHKEYFPAEGDPERARTLLAEAGYPNGEGFPVVELYYNTTDTNADIAQAVQDMWRRELGITIKLVNKETRVFAEERSQGLHEIVRSGNTSSPLAPTILGLFRTNNIDASNDSRFSNEEYDKILAEVDMETNLERLYDLYILAEDILMEEMPVIPIFYYTTIQAMQHEVNGVYKSPAGPIYFHRAFID